MGCASSRDPRSIISPSPPLTDLHQYRSLRPPSPGPAPPLIIVHHPALHPGDSSHLVSLTSTTYNSPLSFLQLEPHQEPIFFMDSSSSSSCPNPNKLNFFLPRSFTYNNHHSSTPTSKKPLWRHLADDSSIPFKPRKSLSGPAVVLYTTSLRGIRHTHLDCCAVRSILRGFRIAVDERDVSMDASYRRELQSLLGKARPFSLPQLFVGGELVGGAEEVRQLHEAGELGKVLDGASRADPTFVCAACGGVRFVPCGVCSGSRKVFVEEEERMRRCDDCNENGLVRCPNCCSSF